MYFRFTGTLRSPLVSSSLLRFAPFCVMICMCLPENLRDTDCRGKLSQNPEFNTLRSTSFPSFRYACSSEGGEQRTCMSGKGQRQRSVLTLTLGSVAAEILQSEVHAIQRSEGHGQDVGCYNANGPVVINMSQEV